MSPALQIFHCADLHLGLKFGTYPDEVAARLREARFLSLERMVDRANRDGCELFVVAGDLFDTLKVAQKDITRAAKILTGFERVTAVLPGNHDFHAGAADDFWKNFPRAEHGRLLLLDEYRPYPLQEFGLDAVLYPSFCHEKKSEGRNALGWLATTPRTEALYQIGLAHGSYEGLSPDLEGDYFPMKASELQAFGFDLWLLGHIHVQYPPAVGAGHRTPAVGAGHRIFYSGTHEPDGMDCRHEGKAWRITLHPDKRVEAISWSTGAHRFLDEACRVSSLAELEAVLARFPAGAAGARVASDTASMPAGETANCLLRLRLEGSLPRESFEHLAGLLEDLKARLLHCEVDASGLALALESADIDREFPRESFGHRLLSSLASDQRDREALQLAYELIRESAR